MAPLPDGATLVTFVDATDRFRIESALRERNEALEASDKLKSEFVKRVSYELRTPLNSIMGFAEMLSSGRQGQLTEKQGEYADAIVRASEGLRDLINDILDLSTIEAGAMELDLQELDLYTLLSGVAEHAQEWAGKIGLTLSLECREDAGTFVGDGRRLRQVVFNLLSNAFKFTPRTGHVTLGGEISGRRRAHLRRGHRARRVAGADAVGVRALLGQGRGGDARGRGARAWRWSTASSSCITAGSSWNRSPGQGTRVTCHLPRRAEAQRRSRA